MNLVRGFDRIALVLVLVMLSPGFYLGLKLSGKLLKTESREYRAWHKQYEEQEKELENEVKGLSKAEVSEKIKKMPARTHKSDSLSKLFNNPSKNPKGFYVQLRLSELWKDKPQKNTYNHPMPSKFSLPVCLPPYNPFLCSSCL
jgi:hypothetical protein